MHSHVHKYKFDSYSSNGHVHRIFGISDTMIGIEAFHIHTFYGISSYNGHSHYYTGYTGLPIKTQNGHIHKIEGELDINSEHTHTFKDYTDEEVEYIGTKKLYKKLNIL